MYLSRIEYLLYIQDEEELKALYKDPQDEIEDLRIENTELKKNNNELLEKIKIYEEKFEKKNIME